MKFMHLADLHLGRSLGDFDLIRDQKYILDQILDLMDEEAVDAVLIAGDVYDKSIPSEAATSLLDSFLNRLAQKGVKTFMISGNHDSDSRLNYGSAIFEGSGIYIGAIYNGALAGYTLEKDGTAVNIFLLPFVKASQVRHYFPDEKIESYDDAVKVIIENADIDPEEINLLVAHQFVTGGGEDPALSGSEGAGTKSVGLVEKISSSRFDLFDYAALGHIHSPQKVGRKEVRYAGSPLKYSLSEVNNAKSVPIITIEKKGEIKIDFRKLFPLRDMRHLRGELTTLLKDENVTDTDDFIYVTLTDEDTIDSAMDIFRQTYPNTVKLDYDNSRTRAARQPDIASITADRSFEELIGDFYRLVYGRDISEEEMEVMKMAAEEAGVTDETD